MLPASGNGGGNLIEHLGMPGPYQFLVLPPDPTPFVLALLCYLFPFGVAFKQEGVAILAELMLQVA